MMTKLIGDCEHGIPGHMLCGACDVITDPTDSQSIESTLAERGNRYGQYGEHARITQAIKAAMADSPNWRALAPDQRETLEMIAHKAGRILNGDPDYHDSWHDIIGYTKLVADRLIPGDAS
jgi:hypothetical protein